MANHSIENLRVIAIDHNLLWSDTSRKDKENFWEHCLKTIPFGMNIRNDLPQRNTQA